MRGSNKRESKTAKLLTQGPTVFIFCDTSSNLDQNLSAYKIFWTPTVFSWSHHQPTTYTLYIDTVPSSLPPTQFMQYFLGEPMHPFYFRYQIHGLIVSFSVSDFRCCIDMSQGSSRQYPTIIDYFGKRKL